MKVEAVILDLFGTLVDDFVASTGPINTDLAVALGLPYEPFIQLWRDSSDMRIDGTFQTIEASIEHVCAAIGADITPHQMNIAVELRLDQIRRALKPKPDAVTTLNRLKDNGYKIGVLSNCSIEIPILWPETPFADLVDSTVFSSRERLTKPDPQIYYLACERLGMVPQKCIYVADGENHELAAAAKVGLHPVLIHNSSAEHRRDLFREARAWQGMSISALTEVFRVVGKC
jgi:putative hydrolase of the HAD superfamily